MRAIFLGKFQPPHLGHIRTILKVAKEYEELTVGITMGNSTLLRHEEVKKIFEEIFENIHNVKIELIQGTIEDGTSELANINFDVVVSGNKKVLNILQEKGYQVRYQSRTEGVGYSGSEIRNLSHNKHLLSLEEKQSIVTFQMLSMADIKPLEKVLPRHLKNIEQMILKDGRIKKPLIVDKKYKIVLDGSHRYAFLLQHGYKYAPCLLVDYDDESIFVGNHLKHRFYKDENFSLSKSEVISRGVNEKLFSARTTRHFFPFRKLDYAVDLDTLEKGVTRDISYLIENINVEEEIKIDQQYIEELDEEMSILLKYIDEQKEVKKYLETQIQLMVDKEL